MRRATRRAGSGSSCGRDAAGAVGLEQRQHRLLVLGDRARGRRGGRRARATRRGDAQRVRRRRSARAGRRRRRARRRAARARVRAEPVDRARPARRRPARRARRPRRRRRAERPGARSSSPARQLAAGRAPASAQRADERRRRAARRARRRRRGRRAAPARRARAARRPPGAGAERDHHGRARSPSAWRPSSAAAVAQLGLERAQRARGPRARPRPRQPARSAIAGTASSTAGRAGSVRCAALPCDSSPWKPPPLSPSPRSASPASACGSTASSSTTSAAVRLATERAEAGEDVARLVTDAIEIGARVLDREQAGANADFVKAEFERAARDLDSEFVERARKVAERLDARIDDVFGARERPRDQGAGAALRRRVLGRGAEPGQGAAGATSARRCARTCASSSPRTPTNNPLADLPAHGRRRDAATAPSSRPTSCAR